MMVPKVPGRTTPGFSFSMIDRTLQECLSVRKFGQEEIKKVLDFFGHDPPECVYCGNKDVKRWDHLIPINRGGETALGNMVPACSQCDDSKRNLPFEEWIICEAKGSPKNMGLQDIPKRVEKIKEYMHHFGYRPRILEERLIDDESKKLQLIRLKLAEVRKDIESLIFDYRERINRR